MIRSSRIPLLFSNRYSTSLSDVLYNQRSNYLVRCAGFADRITLAYWSFFSQKVEAQSAVLKERY
jgi:hypothetical protein